jgi:hypothetical protein
MSKLWKVTLVSLLILLSFSPTGRVSAGINDWISNGPAHTMIYALAIDPVSPAILYAAGSGVFKSTDTAGHWEPANTGLPSTVFFALLIDPLTPTTLYAAGTDVYKSTNSAGNWISTDLTDADSHVTSLVIDPVTPATLYAVVYTTVQGEPDLCLGVFTSTQGGGNWTYTGLHGIQVTALAIDPLTPATLYAASYGGVYKSIDGGVTTSS